MGAWAATIVTENVPRIVRSTMCYDKLDAAALRQHVLSVEDQEALRFHHQPHHHTTTAAQRLT